MLHQLHDLTFCAGDWLGFSRSTHYFVVAEGSPGSLPAIGYYNYGKVWRFDSVKRRFQIMHVFLAKKCKSISVTHIPSSTEICICLGWPLTTPCRLHRHLTWSSSWLGAKFQWGNFCLHACLSLMDMVIRFLHYMIDPPCAWFLNCEADQRNPVWCSLNRCEMT